MGEISKIEWTHATFNPWVGCEKVVGSGACEHCYAEAWAKRTGQSHLWAGERRRTTETYWRGPLKWNAAAKLSGVRRRVFCASLADVWDRAVPREWRRDLFNLIYETPALDWLLLTKRPENIAEMLPGAIGEAELWPWPNVWLGTTAEDQDHWDARLADLARVPAAVHFVSVEPMLSEIDVGNAFDDAPEGSPCSKIDWVICGGESGSGAREMAPAWARSLRDQCAGRSAFFMKQMTKKAPIPSDLMVRQFPGEMA